MKDKCFIVFYSFIVYIALTPYIFTKKLRVKLKTILFLNKCSLHSDIYCEDTFNISYLYKKLQFLQSSVFCC